MSRHELCLEEKINLIKEKEVGFSHRELTQKFKDIFLESTSSKQRSVLEYFKSASGAGT